MTWKKAKDIGENISDSAEPNWKTYLVVFGICFFFSVVIYVVLTADPRLLNLDDENEEVVGRVARSIEGFPDAGKHIDSTVMQRNTLVEYDPDYLRDRHKSASKRRVKKVLKLDDYWKFWNEKEVARKNEEANYDDVLSVNEHRSLNVHEDEVSK